MENNDSLSVLRERLDTLLLKVDEIKVSLDSSEKRLVDVEKDILTLTKDTQRSEDRIERLETTQKSQKTWLMGIAATIIGGVLLALLKFELGI